MRGLRAGYLFKSFFFLCILCFVLTSCEENPYLDKSKYYQEEEVIHFFLDGLQENNLLKINAVLENEMEYITWENEAINSLIVEQIQYNPERTLQYAQGKYYAVKSYDVVLTASYLEGRGLSEMNGKQKYYFVLTKNKRVDPWKIFEYGQL